MNCWSLLRACTHFDNKSFIDERQLRRRKSLGGDASHLRRRYERVAIAPNLNSLCRKYLRQHPSYAIGYKSPMPWIARVPHAAMCIAKQKDPTRFQHSMQLSHRLSQITDDTEHMRADDAVEGISRQIVGFGYVCHNRCRWIRSIEVHYVETGDRFAADLAVCVVLKFQTAPTNVTGGSRKKRSR